MKNIKNSLLLNLWINFIQLAWQIVILIGEAIDITILSETMPEMGPLIQIVSYDWWMTMHLELYKNWFFFSHGPGNGNCAWLVCGIKNR